MKTKIILVILIIFQVNLVVAQQIYYDAVAISKTNAYQNDGTLKLDPINAKIILPILAYYAGTESTFNKVKAYYNASPNGDNNPFFEISGTANFNTLGSKKIGNYSKSALGAIGGLDVTKYAEGMAIFMINRAKQELNVAFFQRFKDYLAKYPEVQTLFPETYRVTTNILAYNYTNMLTVLRAAYYQDLSHILPNLENVFMLQKYKKLTLKFPEILLSIRTANIIAASVENELSPSEIIEKMSQIDGWYDNTTDKYYLSNVGNGFRLASLISNSLIHDPFPNYVYDKVDVTSINDSTKFYEDTYTLDTTIVTLNKVYKKLSITTRTVFSTKDKDGNTFPQINTIIKYTDTLDRSDHNIWLTKSEFQTFLLNKKVFKVYLGLLYQQAKTKFNDKIIFISNKKDSNGDRETMKLTQFLENKKDTISIIENIVYSFFDQANLVNNTIKEIKSKEKDKITNKDYVKYINSSISILQFGLTVAKTVYPTIAENAYVSMTNSSFNLYKNTFDENYASAIMNVVDISEDVVKLVNSNKSESNAGSTEEEIQDNDINNFSKAFSKISSYGVFMANVIEAKDAQEIANIIETAAMPVGGSSVKKYSCFTIDFGSYLGGYTNFLANENPQRSWDRRFGVTAPIGVNFSWGLNKAGSISAFAVLLDIGAIVDYKLNNDSTAIENTITLGNIFSPGGYLVYGLGGNIPLSVGFGGQYGPGLYKVDENEVQIKSSAFSLRLFIAFDIPFITVYSKKKKTKFKRQ